MVEKASVVLFLIFFFGASVASFLQMYLDTGGKNLWRGWGDSSSCDGCGKELKWHELVPVVSSLFVFLKSKTSCCGQALSPKYLFGEVALGLWFVGVGIWFEASHIQIIIGWILGGIFFMLVIQDLKEMLVNARYLYVLCAVAIFGAILIWLQAGMVGDLSEVVFPILVFAPFWIIYFLGKYLEKPMIGEADPYTFTALGIFFGTQFSVSLFLYSVWLGAFLGVGYLYFVNKKFERNIPIPFLPVIFLACIFILVFNYHVVQIQDILFINETFTEKLF
jgi:prepilin signal peptidase PulO-like enzyme (type II secretory pathway)